MWRAQAEPESKDWNEADLGAEVGGCWGGRREGGRGGGDTEEMKRTK